jgi:hypothetical protein
MNGHSNKSRYPPGSKSIPQGNWAEPKARPFCPFSLCRGPAGVWDRAGLGLALPFPGSATLGLLLSLSKALFLPLHQKSIATGHWWLMPVILGIQWAEITRRITVWSQPVQIVHKALFRKYPSQKRVGGVVKVVECQPSKHEPWVQIPVLPKNKSQLHSPCLGLIKITWDGVYKQLAHSRCLINISPFSQLHVSHNLCMIPGVYTDLVFI